RANQLRENIRRPLCLHFDSSVRLQKTARDWKLDWRSGGGWPSAERIPSPLGENEGRPQPYRFARCAEGLREICCVRRQLRAPATNARRITRTRSFGIIASFESVRIHVQGQSATGSASCGSRSRSAAITRSAT